MELNIFLRFYLLLGCGLFISCQNVQRNFEQLDNSSDKVLEKIKYPKELDEYLEKNRNKRDTNENDRSFKIFKNFQPDEELPNLNYKSSAGPNAIREMKISKKVDYLSRSFSENKKENFTVKTLLEPELEGKDYKNTKSSKHSNKNPTANRIRRESPQIFGYTGSAGTKKRISSADKFLKLDEKERERLLEKVFNEINIKLNKPEFGNGCIDNDESVEVKPQLLILNSKSKPKREKNSETEPFVLRAVENPYSSKTDTATPSSSFNNATETVISADLTAKPGVSSIGRQTGRNNVNIEQFTKNSKNFSKREDTQYQTDGIYLTTFVPEVSKQESSMKEPMEVQRVKENNSDINNRHEITTDQSDNIKSQYIPFTSEKLVQQRNKNGQPQLFQVLRTPFETNKLGKSQGPSDSPKRTERMNKNNGEDSELMEYIKNYVKNCLREMKKDVNEDLEKPETMERNQKDETSIDSKEYYPKEISPELIKQLSLLDKLNNLNSNSPGLQLLWNILQSTPSKPYILSRENQKAQAEYASPYKPPLIAEDNYLDEASSEENGNDSYDIILQTDLKNLNDFVRTYTKSNMEEPRFDRFLYLLDDLFL